MVCVNGYFDVGLGEVIGEGLDSLGRQADVDDELKDESDGGWKVGFVAL